MTTESPNPLPTTPGRPKKGEEKIDLPICWKLRFQKRLTYDEIASHFGCHKSAVERACKKLQQLFPSPAEVAAFRESKGEILEAAQFRLLSTLMSPDKLRKATTNQVAFGFSKVSEQLRLERNQSTSNIGLISRLIVEADGGLFKQESARP